MEEAAATPIRAGFTFNRAPGTPPVVVLDPALAPQKRGRKIGQGAFKADAVGEDSDVEILSEDQTRSAPGVSEKIKERAVPVIQMPPAYMEAMENARIVKHDEAVVHAFWIGAGSAAVLIIGVCATYYILRPHFASKTVSSTAAAAAPALKYAIPPRGAHPL